MVKRKKSFRTLLQVLIIVLICSGVLLMGTHTAFAWSSVVIIADQPFSIGTDLQEYWEGIRVTEPPADVIEDITFGWYSPNSWGKSVVVIENEEYQLYVDITLKDGESFDENLSFEFHNMEPLALRYKNCSARSIECSFIADLTNYRIVRFDANGGYPRVQLGSTVVNGTITPPEVPRRTGYKFDGWWTSDTGGELFDFNQPIQKDFPLFAHWISVAPPTTTTTTTTKTTTTTTTTMKEAATTVEETTEWPIDPGITSVSETSPAITTAATDSETGTDERPSLPLIVAVIVAACLIGGAVGYFLYTIREKKRKR